MRRLYRRYSRLTVPQKRLYSLLTVITGIALLFYCLGIGSVVARSRLVRETALEIPPTFTASPTSVPTATAPPGSTPTPTSTLPPTPTQRPIPTFTPTPESVNITVVITDTQGVTSTVVISATVTPTPELTATVTVTAEASLMLSDLEPVRPSGHGTALSPAQDIAYADRHVHIWNRALLAQVVDPLFCRLSAYPSQRLIIAAWPGRTPGNTLRGSDLYG
jgi:hypothetical protein